MIALSGGGCPFLSAGLCSIQQRLGEGFLPKMCATYPRVVNRVDDVLQRSLDLACPEASRVLLLDPQPMQFEEREYTDGSIHLENLPSLDTSSLTECSEPYVSLRTFGASSFRCCKTVRTPFGNVFLSSGFFAKN
jgi:hypothetical protein